jgi:hypothetical protein
VVRYSGQRRCLFRFLTIKGSTHMSETTTSSPAIASTDTLAQDDAGLRSEQEAAQEEWKAIGSLPADERDEAAREWAGKFGHLFYWCCGSPVFGGADSETYYEENDFYKRGDLHGSRVYWYGG